MISGLSSKYQYKIKTADELAAILGPTPRARKVIMCHGVFDVVHPGHLRHLIYAKSKADILVASLTADLHITKGTFRPHVPQDLRALNLAAFELVDYVLIDANDKPLENLRIIQPDFFAKGYEYNANVGGLSEKTQEEVDVMAAYGGEIIFTPGDIVYSSSKLIESQPPNIGMDKLLTLMDTAGITFDILKNTIAKFNSLKVHVIGDTIVDTFTQCAMIGGQTKTPTMSVLFQERKDYIGGAAVVAEHLCASGAKVVFSTVLGDDALRDFVLAGLGKSGVEVHAIIDHTRPTTNKNAIVAGGYRLLKVDTLDNRSISDDIQAKLAESIATVEANAVVFSDFRHGIFNRRTIPPLVAAIPDSMFKVADSQVASRWGNITEFQNFDLLTPNEREARFALADQDSGIRPLASRLYDAAKCKMLLMKLGDRGVITCRSDDHEALDSFFVVDSFVRRVADAVGAGDALLAYATLSMLATKDPVVATIIGSIAAALECEVDGNIPITQDKVLERIISLEEESLYQR
jgi:rfaE bifunctional protein kinase chain/domain